VIQRFLGYLLRELELFPDRLPVLAVGHALA
jgi:hypothetical protein